MPQKRKNDYVPHIPTDKAPPCHVAGCGESGVYKAPRSKDELHSYLWFCLEHIREHNQKWDFFAGLDAAAIEFFIKDATVGHRPTWTRETRTRARHQEQLRDALYEFLNPGGRRAPKPAAPISAKLRKALAVMDLSFPYTAKELKSQYRLMVKKHHPDVNKGDKKSEEIFKRVTAAYHFLAEENKKH